MNLSQRPPLAGRVSPQKRVGRGYGSGRGGHTSSRGAKGQKARNKVPRYFEGGQLPLVKRLPQFNKKSRVRTSVIILPLSSLELLPDGVEITPQVLLDQGLLKELPVSGVKIVGRGEISRAFHLKQIKASKNVARQILAAGGSLQ